MISALSIMDVLLLKEYYKVLTSYEEIGAVLLGWNNRGLSGVLCYIAYNENIIGQPILARHEKQWTNKSVPHNRTKKISSQRGNVFDVERQYSVQLTVQKWCPCIVMSGTGRTLRKSSFHTTNVFENNMKQTYSSILAFSSPQYL